MLVLNFDEGGTDVVKEQLLHLTPKTFLAGEGYTVGCEPPVTVIDFNTKPSLDLIYKPTASSEALNNVILVCHKVMAMNPLPYKTVVLDPVTTLVDIVLQHVSAFDNNALNSALRWAPMAGGKVYQIITYLQSLQCNVVTILHSAVDKIFITRGTGKDATEEVIDVLEQPLIPSGAVREKIGGLFSQFLYAFISNGQPKVRTQPFGYIKGIGCRWPHGLPAVVDPLFDNIYGSEKEVLR
jgi:hypothetical protein